MIKTVNKHLFFFLIVLFFLASLNLAFGYDRKEYGGWKQNIQTSCNTRQEVLLIRYVKVYEKVGKCKISGLWIDFYTGALLSDWNKIDIDHLLPVAYYDKHCRKNKPLKEIRKFYNDTENLVITSKEENRKKGSKTKEQYAPLIKNETRRKAYIEKYDKIYNKHCN